MPLSFLIPPFLCSGSRDGVGHISAISILLPNRVHAAGPIASLENVSDPSFRRILAQMNKQGGFIFQDRGIETYRGVLEI